MEEQGWDINTISIMDDAAEHPLGEATDGRRTRTQREQAGRLFHRYEEDPGNNQLPRGTLDRPSGTYVSNLRRLEDQQQWRIWKSYPSSAGDGRQEASGSQSNDWWATSDNYDWWQDDWWNDRWSASDWR